MHDWVISAYSPSIGLLVFDSLLIIGSHIICKHKQNTYSLVLQLQTIFGHLYAGSGLLKFGSDSYMSLCGAPR